MCFWLMPLIKKSEKGEKGTLGDGENIMLASTIK